MGTAGVATGRVTPVASIWGSPRTGTSVANRTMDSNQAGLR